jgi:hypothetical protein
VDDVLHALRLKGIATPQAIADVTGRSVPEVDERLAQLDGEGLALERPSRKRPGWVLTEEGRDRHADLLAAAHSPDEVTTLAEHYEGFLAVNPEVKGLAARWQAAGGDDERFALIDRLEEIHERVLPVFDRAGGTVERFGRYAHRLGAALERLDDDPRYFVSPRVDSYHTVWFECHEDFLLTLGRTRRGEGSE